MILLVAFALAVAWGLVRGGQISQIQSLTLRGYGLVLAALGIQIGVIYVPLAFAWAEPLRVVLLVFSYGLLGLFVWWNRQLPGMWIIGLGLVANWAVIIANGGHMPVAYEALVAAGKANLVTSATTGTAVFGSKDILLPGAETRLGFLADIFVIPPPFPLTAIFSIGDVLIAVGMFFLVPFALSTRPGDRGGINSKAVGDAA